MEKKKKISIITTFTLTLSLLISLFVFENTNLIYGGVDSDITEEKVRSITFAPNNEYFLINENLIEEKFSPVNYNDNVYVPFEYILEKLGYDVAYNFEIPEIKSETESYTVNYSEKRIKNNISNETIININFLTLNDIVFIDLENLVEIFSLHEYEQGNIYTLGIEYNEELFENSTKIFEESAISFFKPFNTEENFENYINVLKEINSYPYNYYMDKNIDDVPFGQVLETENNFTEMEVSESPNIAVEESNTNNDFSGTVTQYETVDEGDIVKTDGKYIYYARMSDSYNRDTVEIIQSNDNGKSELISTILVEDVIIKDLYIANDQLVIIGSNNYMYTNTISEEEIYLNAMTESFAMQYDINNKEEPKLERKSNFTGYYTDSRLIDNRLYVYTNKYNSYYYDDNDMLPKFKSNTNSDYKNIPYENIYYNTSSFSDGAMFCIYSFDLQKPEEELDAYMFLTNSSEINVNDKNMYLYTNNSESFAPIILYLNSDNVKELYSTLESNNYYRPYFSNKSTIYKFEMDNGKITFLGGANVKGFISSQYYMDEYEGYLRVATNGFDENNFVQVNKLYVFDENMKQVGSIDSFAKNENMHSVRFMGDKAYVVTFRNTDPLFAIDLKNPANPQILGELKIPGFSTFMLPIDENHLVGIGTDTQETDRGFIVTGMKMSLFDVTDMLNPKEKFVTYIGDNGTYSEVQHNPRAIMYNPQRELLGFPITFVGETSFDGATVYNVNPEKGFEHLGYIVHSTDINNAYNNSTTEYQETNELIDIGISMPNYNQNNKIERIIQIKNNIYTISNERIKSTSLEPFKNLSEVYFE